MIAWDRDQGTVKVGPHPDTTGWSNEYSRTVGCCFNEVQNMEDQELAKALLGEAIYMMSEGVPPIMVLTEFSKIRIWREMRITLTSGEYWAFLDGRRDPQLNPHFDPERNPHSPPDAMECAICRAQASYRNNMSGNVYCVVCARDEALNLAVYADEWSRLASMG